VQRVSAEMGADIFSNNGDSLEEVVLHLLDLGAHTLSVAESCTGGWLAQRLTGVPNSSRVFAGGVVTYSDASKTTLAGVPPEVIEEQGTVNHEVAARMAEGIRQRMDTTLAIGITGIAGPGVPSGPDADKPVGLVYVALATTEGTRVLEVKITGDRDRVRLWATQHALEMIRLHLL
jgi:nicotinamide-nucleotide amidase